MNPLQADSNDPLIVIISNRGPFKFTKVEDKDEFSVERGSGGLVTALSALAQKHEVLWVASAMSNGDRQWVDAHDGEVQTVDNIFLQLITPDEDRYNQYYKVIANPMLWFIQHQLWDIVRNPSIDAETWDAWKDGYIEINRQFAETVAETLKDVDRPIIIMPQDYHLYLAPKFLRQKLGDRVQIQPFLHIPWPGPDAWRLLPSTMRDELLRSLLQSDRIGFQTKKDAFNFVQTCRFYLHEAHSRGSRDTVYYKDRPVKALDYPISIDVEQVEELAEQKETQLLKSQLHSLVGDNKLILRVDRVEPSKNILRGLEAFKTLLKNHPEYKGKVKMLALLVPSRMEVSEYQTYLRDIMAMTGLINAEFSDGYWEPVRVMVGDNYNRAIAAMQMYDVLLVNPIADGMNLVAKEGALVNQRNGCLLLSEYAGAYYELSEYATSLSPFDAYGTAEAIHGALTMSPEQRRERANGLRKIIRRSDVRDWFYDQVQDALSTTEVSHSKNEDTSSTSEADMSASVVTNGGVSAPNTPMDAQ